MSFKTQNNIMPNPCLIRTIHPVGHGAFYTEELYDGNRQVTVVYDCGWKEKTDKTALQREVNGFLQLPVKRHIDILFISHFDSDHVDGIKMLQPYIDRQTKLVMAFKYDYFYVNSPEVKYLSQAINIVSASIPRLVWVASQDGSNIKGGEAQRLDGLDITDMPPEMIVSSGSPLSLNGSL